MPWKKWFVVAGFLASLNAFPCGNSYRSLKEMEKYTQSNALELFIFRQNFSSNSLESQLQLLGDEIKTGLNLFQDENDRALTLMRMGKYDSALAILQRLERQKPNEYNIIANLGTLYELMGENDKALQYIQRALTLDSGSHHGSEWFHVQVLQAKIRSEKVVEGYYRTHPILNFSLVKKTPNVIMSDLTYQLKERIPFTPKPDYMMAKIVEQSADYFLAQKKEEHAWVLYKIATQYEPDSTYSIYAKLKLLESHLVKEGKPLPDFATHFTISDEWMETGKKLLEQGIEAYNKYNVPAETKVERKGNGMWTYILIGGIVTVVVIVLLTVFVRRPK